MEKVQGRNLGDIWYELSEKERLKALSQVGKLESVLFSVSLPAYGSVYHKGDLEVGSESIDIGGDLDATQFSIRPDVAHKWWYDGRDDLPISRQCFASGRVYQGTYLTFFLWYLPAFPIQSRTETSTITRRYPRQT
jgi:hypothetical protein